MGNIEKFEAFIVLVMTVVIGCNAYTQRKLPFRIEFKYILFHDAAFHQLVNSWPESTTVSTWGKWYSSYLDHYLNYLKCLLN